jgi:hypothetical protein
MLRRITLISVTILAFLSSDIGVSGLALYFLLRLPKGLK